MANRAVVTIMALGLFVMAIGLFIPPLLDSQDANLRDSVELDEGEETTFDELVKVKMNDVDHTTSPTHVNVTVVDVGTLQETTVDRLNETNSTTVSPAGDNITVTNEAVVDSDTAQVSASFPHTYGWEDTAVTFLDNLDILLVLVGVLMILGSVVRVVD